MIDVFIVVVLTNSSLANTFMRQQYYDISLDCLFRQRKLNFSLFVTTLQKGMPDREQQTKVEVNSGAHCPLPPPGIYRTLLCSRGATNRLRGPLDHSDRYCDGSPPVNTTLF